jgi:hypothetical protein
MMRSFRFVVYVIGLNLGCAVLPALGASGYAIHSPDLTVELARDGKIVGVVLGNKKIRWSALGQTALAGCRIEGKVESERQRDGGVRFKKRLLCDGEGVRREVRLVEVFVPTQDSVRWEMELDGQGPPWSTAIETRLHFPNVTTKRFWTAWGDPRPDEDADPSWGADPSWQDPLTPTDFPDRVLWYGAPYYKYDRPRIGVPMPFRDVFCIPLATIIENKNDIGLSLALSPEDLVLEMTLGTSARGDLTFSRLFRRISEGKPVHFSMDLIAHEGDWRGGMRWMTTRYADFFNPPLARADRLGGTAAYSSYEGALDVAKLKRMAFTFNWKASFDFPYQGMFIPPVTDDLEWTRGYRMSESPPFDLGPTASIRQMAGYSRRMREMGFDVLNYFNEAEFGKNIVYPPPPRKAQSDSDLWKDPNDYLNAKLADALIYRPDKEVPTPGGANSRDPYYRAAYNNVVLDWGEPSWQNFLLDQAQKLIEKIPDSAGICFDRLDWLRLYNFRRDDGVTWYDGPARSLIWSWKDLMDRLGPVEHGAGQVIFVNNLVSRIDILRHADGLFSELAHWGGSLNATALSAVRKPAIGWIFGEYTVKELAKQRRAGAGDVGWVFGEERPTADADAFLQKFVYLGVFPMAPFPQNDHSPLPSARADALFLDYGPMFEAMRERKWVLLPHAISVEGGSAKANLFQVPGGYLFPVTLGGSAPSAMVTIRGIPEILAGKELHGELIHPGDAQWKACEFSRRNSTITLKVPLHRGCAMVRLHAG